MNDVYHVSHTLVNELCVMLQLAPFSCARSGTRDLGLYILDTRGARTAQSLHRKNILYFYIKLSQTIPPPAGDRGVGGEGGGSLSLAQGGGTINWGVLLSE